jgi:nucleotide-binding universal stress UspA family protein
MGSLNVHTFILLLSSLFSHVAFAEKDNVDLIIIGTRGRSGFRKLLLGGVASGVVTYSHCPVMVVKWQYTYN